MVSLSLARGKNESRRLFSSPSSCSSLLKATQTWEGWESIHQLCLPAHSCPMCPGFPACLRLISYPKHGPARSSESVAESSKDQQSMSPLSGGSCSIPGAPCEAAGGVIHHISLVLAGGPR